MHATIDVHHPADLWKYADVEVGGVRRIERSLSPKEGGKLRSPAPERIQRVESVTPAQRA